MLNLSFASVQNIVRKYKNDNTIENKPRTGRPKKLSRRDVSHIMNEVVKNPRISAPNLAESIAKISGKRVHPKTVQRVIRNNGYRRSVLIITFFAAMLSSTRLYTLNCSSSVGKLLFSRFFMFL